MDDLMKKLKMKPVDIAIVIMCILIGFFLIKPIMQKKDINADSDKAAQASLEDAITKAATVKNLNRITPPTLKDKVPSINWVTGSDSPTGADTIAVSAGSGGNNIVICNKSLSGKYFCIRKDKKSKTYGSSYSYITARLATQPAFK